MWPGCGGAESYCDTLRHVWWLTPLITLMDVVSMVCQSVYILTLTLAIVGISPVLRQLFFGRLLHARTWGLGTTNPRIMTTEDVPWVCLRAFYGGSRAS